jgi:hypothetical protein
LSYQEERFMGVAGAKVLEIRLRAGYFPGTVIEVDQAGPRSGVAPGDVGAVVDISDTGVVVDWNTGVRSVIDPNAVTYHALRRSVL